MMKTMGSCKRDFCMTSSSSRGTIVRGRGDKGSLYTCAERARGMGVERGKTTDAGMVFRLGRVKR
jgi:hypothetical protein